MTHALKQYLLVTFNYWNFTLTDGALRMLVVLHFHHLGYSALSIAMLFLFYEVFGVITNLVGGWLATRLGLNSTMNLGLALQIIALLALAAPAEWLSIPYVMAAQALSGIAKDLNKMSAKSSIKMLLPEQQQSALYKWVAILTGSKNALKGAGFFLGGGLLAWFGFTQAMLGMAAVLAAVLVMSLLLLQKDLGKAKAKTKFRDIFSKSRSVNVLSAARMFLFGARDVWFVVALPVYLASVFDWPHLQVSGFLAVWVIGYGLVQGVAPILTRIGGQIPDGRAALWWASILAAVTALVASLVTLQWQPQLAIVIGLLVFGAVFAVNSSLHSYLIVSYADRDGVSLDVGFYYMANAMGRLIGTVLSGLVYQLAGLTACLWVSVAFLLATSVISIALPKGK
ncbi:organoarsenical effux MFS transporter ArsJ [Neiella marina]|uniref:Organoarsenical effux MFS transporter ArsJ n=1 Tax=Neiella holothuriorum TaxID=2870530 RepID=A0ABS7ECE1_9GAMM|nr:organoarsenical effux MFS transporter ArsJ [Neiella holothuriorum]MBW8190003.1 organoarsenical effux MFS transporter ArsJ [Neiella holothuriorum]